MTPAYPRGSSKSLQALEKEGAMRLGQIRSGTSQASSSSAASFVRGRYGHSLQLKACSSRRPELLQSTLKSLLLSLRVFKNLLFQWTRVSVFALVLPLLSHSKKRSCLASLADSLS